MLLLYTRFGSFVDTGHNKICAKTVLEGTGLFNTEKEGYRLEGSLSLVSCLFLWCGPTSWLVFITTNRHDTAGQMWREVVVIVQRRFIILDPQCLPWTFLQVGSLGVCVGLAELPYRPGALTGPSEVWCT